MSITGFFRTAATRRILAAGAGTALLCGTLCAGEPETAVYAARLSPLNAPAAAGTAELILHGDNLIVTVEAAGLTPDTPHLPEIRWTGTAPAAPANDTNGDTVIDAAEAEAAAGPSAIPLDETPADLMPDSAAFPPANFKGRLSYRRTISLSLLKDALLGRYGSGELPLEGAVILLRSGEPGGLPVACGTIRRVQ